MCCKMMLFIKWIIIMTMKLKIEPRVPLHVQFSEAIMTSQWTNEFDESALSSTIPRCHRSASPARQQWHWLWHHQQKVTTSTTASQDDVSKQSEVCAIRLTKAYDVTTVVLGETLP